MQKILDAIAYRLLSKVPEYTPKMHYDLRERLGDLANDTALPFWWAIIRWRVGDVYWMIRGLVER